MDDTKEIPNRRWKRLIRLPWNSSFSLKILRSVELLVTHESEQLYTEEKFHFLREKISKTEAYESSRIQETMNIGRLLHCYGPKQLMEILSSFSEDPEKFTDVYQLPIPIIEDKIVDESDTDQESEDELTETENMESYHTRELQSEIESVEVGLIVKLVIPTLTKKKKMKTRELFLYEWWDNSDASHGLALSECGAFQFLNRKNRKILKGLRQVDKTGLRFRAKKLKKILGRTPKKLRKELKAEAIEKFGTIPQISRKTFKKYGCKIGSLDLIWNSSADFAISLNDAFKYYKDRILKKRACLETGTNWTTPIQATKNPKAPKSLPIIPILPLFSDISDT